MLGNLFQIYTTVGAQMKRVFFLPCILWLYEPFESYKSFNHIKYVIHIFCGQGKIFWSVSHSKKNYSCGLKLFGESFWNITF